MTPRQALDRVDTLRRDAREAASVAEVMTRNDRWWPFGNITVSESLRGALIDTARAESERLTIEADTLESRIILRKNER